MRKNFGVKALLYPEPVLVIATYGADDVPNAMVAAWGGLSEENEISICVSDEHQTALNLQQRGAFTVSIATVAQLKACDYVGMVSGKKCPYKLEKTGWTLRRSELVDAPIIEELPMTLECKVKLYDAERCRLVGEIVNVSADETILTNGAIDPKKLNPLVYDGMNHVYYALGEQVGNAHADGGALM